MALKRVMDAHNLGVVLLQKIVSKGGRMVSNYPVYANYLDSSLVESPDEYQSIQSNQYPPISSSLHAINLRKSSCTHCQRCQKSYHSKLTLWNFILMESNNIEGK
jgi:hypothetical protein